MFRTHTKVGQKIGGFFRTFPKTLIWLRFGRYGTLHMYFVPYMTNSPKSLIHTISCRYEKSTKAVRTLFWVSVPKKILICFTQAQKFLGRIFKFQVFLIHLSWFIFCIIYFEYIDWFVYFYL